MAKGDLKSRFWRFWNVVTSAALFGSVLGFAYFFSLTAEVCRGCDVVAAYLFAFGLIAGASAMYLATEA